MPDALVTVSYLTAHKDYLDMYEVREVLSPGHTRA